MDEKRFFKKDSLIENTERNKKIKTVFIGGMDRPFLFLVFLLLGLGIIMVFTSSYAFAKNRFDDSFYFAKRQGFFAVSGIVWMLVAANVLRARKVVKFIFKNLLNFYIIAVLLNLGVIAFGFATHGARRWISLGPVNFQPSEILKIATILLCAGLISKFSDKMKEPKFGLLMFLPIFLTGVAILIMQSHLSATIILVLIIYSMMMLGGTSLKVLAPVGAVGIGAAFFVITNIDTIVEWDFIKNKLGHVYNRLLVWSDPFKYMTDDESGWAGWQPSQSLYAISSGGVWGVGLGQSMEKHGYLPEPQNDYIFSIICEEFGFVGAVVIILLFAALIWRGFHIAHECSDRFCSLTIYGIMIQLALQVILNIGVVTNTLPSTGISLPFFSYGGTSLWITLIEMGLVLGFSRYSFTEKGD